MTPSGQIQKVAPSGDVISLEHVKDIRAGAWDEPDHLYVAPCGCKYDIRAHGRGKGWSSVCPTHRGSIQLIESVEARDVLPYGCSVGEYLAGNHSAAFIAFLERRKWQPATYEYGSNAGDYTSELESRANELWFHRVRQDMPMRSVLIARW